MSQDSKDLGAAEVGRLAEQRQTIMPAEAKVEMSNDPLPAPSSDQFEESA